MAGGFHCPDSAQRHQALFGLGRCLHWWAAGSVPLHFGQGFGALKFLNLATEHKENLLVPSPPPSSASIGD